MNNRHQYDLGQAHQQYAHLHQSHAQAHQQQAMYHHQQAEMHQRNAHAYSMQQGQGHMMYPNQPAYNEKNTAYNDQVSPAALVFRGHISPEAIQSLSQYQNPYATPANPALSQHAAHAVENQRALQSGYRF
ncbi:hypothetical protein [Brevibacillus sp. FSL K6-2834]|uniref:hypothetical protein n=1 Tax=Brevibacillus sp. FSL K6-2834 TaxID=2954680 RepID=UPI0031593859